MSSTRSMTHTLKRHAKLGSGPQSSLVTTTATAAVGGKRRLDFDDTSRAFCSKTFFLDLPGHKNVHQLERELVQRGGKVEKFFHRGVKYLITTRPKDDSKSRSTPSPLTPSGRGMVQIMSPLESVSPNSVEGAGRGKPQQVAYQTRAAMMLAASREKRGSKKAVDLLAMARSWGCKILTLDALLNELKKLKPLPKQTRDETRSGSSNGKVHSLRVPYVKVEDQSRGYRPLVYELKAWPRPRRDTSPNGCPFDPQRQPKVTERPNTRSSAGSKSPRKSTRPSQPRQTSNHPMMTRLKKPGYCECCAVRYEDLQMHLRSGKHVEYATTDSNFTSLDGLISRGQNYSQFVSALRSKYKTRTPTKNSPKRVVQMKRSPQHDTVLLITPPFTPHKTRSPKTPMKQVTPVRQSPVRQAAPSILSPRGRKSPRFALSRVGVALRPKVESPPRKTITLRGSTFTSPKMGELRITPVADSPKATSTPQFVLGKEYTPGFRTPISSHGKAARIDAIAARLSNHVSSPAASRKRTRSSSEVDGSPVKKVRLEAVQDEFVPETPEKPLKSRKATPPSTLCSLETIFDRIRETAHSATPPDVGKIATDLHDLINVVTNETIKSSLKNSSPGSSPSAVRKSPRLIEKEKRRSQMRVTTRTERIVSFSPTSLMVSYNLRLLKSRQDTNVSTPKMLLQPMSGITPEIPLQGLPFRDMSSSLRTEQSGSEQSFPGFSPGVVGHALMQRLFDSSGNQFSGFSPSTVEQALPGFIRRSPRIATHVGVQTLRLAKRKRSSEPDEVGTDCIPVSKRRRTESRSHGVSARSPPRSPRLS